MSDDVRSAIDLINNLNRDGVTAMRDAERTAQQTVTNLTSAMNDYTNVVKSTIGGFMSAEDSFKKFNGAVDSAVSGTSKLAITGFGAWGVAIAGIVKILGSVTKGIFAYNDNMLKGFDNLAQLGVSIGTSSDALNQIVNDAGFASGTLSKFEKAFGEANRGLLNMGPTTSSALKQFSTILKIAPQMRDELFKLGYSPEQIAVAQAKFVDLQASYGMTLEKNANKIRFESLQYAKNLTVLTTLTGESRDKIAERLAQAALDTKYKLYVREVNEKYGRDTVTRIENSVALADSLFGPTVAAGARDFLANGFASTKEGEAIMRLTRGRVAKWATLVEKGEMSETDFVKKIGESMIQQADSNREALKVSTDYAQMTGITAKGLQNATSIQKAQNIEEVKDTINNNKNVSSGLKEAQVEQYNIERLTSQSVDKIAQHVAGPVNDAFIKLANIVQNFAKGCASLGAYFGMEGMQEIKEEMMTVGELENEIKVNKENVKEIEKRLRENAPQKAEIKKVEQAHETAVEQVHKAQESGNKEELERAEAAERKAAYEERQKKLEMKNKKIYTGKSDEARRDKIKKDTERQEKLLEKKKEQEKVAQESAKPTEAPPLPTAAPEKQPAITTGKGPGYDQIAQAGLRIKQGDVAGGGTVTPKVLELAKRIQNEFPGFVRFTGMNDEFHKKKVPNSDHTRGEAVDFVINEKPTVEQGRELVKLLRSMGATYAQDEYNFPSKNAVGSGHFHAQIKAKFGGVFSGPESGYPITAHGKEAVIPLLNDNSIPITLSGDALSAHVESLISKAITKSGTSNESIVDHELFRMLSAKVSQMSTAVEQSTNNHHTLKMFMRN